MRPRDFLSIMTHSFRPRTPNTALRAVERKILPPESYMYKASSVIPLDAENITLEELDRILGQPDRNLITNLFLIDILEILLDHPDTEKALYAAESISLIENSYNVKIEEQKKNLKKEASAQVLMALSDLYYEMALLNGTKKTIKNFYLKEAFSFIRKKQTMEPLDGEESKKMVRLLMELGLYYQARNIVRQYQGDPEMMILEAEAEFAVRNYTGVAELCRSLYSMKDFLDIDELKLLDFWISDGKN